MFVRRRRNASASGERRSEVSALNMPAGSLLLFVHSHGDHPEAAKIQFHHALLGIVGVGAAFSKGFASWLPGASSQMRNRWDMVWAGSIILSGLLLLAYSE